MQSQRKLLWGTLTLTSAALASRGLGLLYRMLLARFLGAEGLGVFQMIFPLYVALVTLAVAGTPVAVSQMVAEGRREARSLVRLATAIVLAVSIPLMLIVYVGARPLALTLYHDSRFVPLLWAIAPALLAVAFSAVLRGYFIGLQRVEVPAASQVAEQLARVVIMFAILNMMGRQIPHAPIVAVILIPVGEGVSLMILAWAYWHNPHLEMVKAGSAVRIYDILKLSLPVTFSRLLGSLVAVIEATMIPLRLQASGLSRYAAIQYFGQLTGMALPLIFFPTALTLSLATNLVPVVAQAHAQGDMDTIRQHMVDGLKATALVTVPVTAILLTIGVQLDDLFFHTQIPAMVFVPLVVGGFFLYFDITLSGTLRGLGRTGIPMRNDLIASAVEVFLIWILAARPGLGAEGVALALALGFVLSFALNLMAALALTRTHIGWFSLLAKPALATLPAIFFTDWWQQWAHLNGWTQVPLLLTSISLATAIYVMAWRLMGVSWRSFT